MNDNERADREGFRYLLAWLIPVVIASLVGVTALFLHYDNAEVLKEIAIGVIAGAGGIGGGLYLGRRQQ